MESEREKERERSMGCTAPRPGPSGAAGFGKTCPAGACAATVSAVFWICPKNNYGAKIQGFLLIVFLSFCTVKWHEMAWNGMKLQCFRCGLHLRTNRTAKRYILWWLIGVALLLRSGIWVKAASLSQLRSSPALFSLDAVGSPKLLVIHIVMHCDLWKFELIYLPDLPTILFFWGMAWHGSGNLKI